MDEAGGDAGACRSGLKLGFGDSLSIVRSGRAYGDLTSVLAAIRAVPLRSITRMVV